MVTKWRDWKLAHPDFPLTVHPSGQWSKKVRGHIYYFGPLRDYEGALQLWTKEKDYLLAGIRPPTVIVGLTVAELVAKHLVDIDNRIAAGKVSHRTRGDYVYLPKILEKAGIFNVTVDSLSPVQFATLQNVIEATGRSLRSQKNMIMSIKSLFNWGGPEGMGLVKEMQYGPRFISPGTDAIEQEQEKSGLVRFIDRELLLKAINAAEPRMRLAILFGINCAFYPSDTISIAYDNIHLDCDIPYHNFRRVKTKRRRIAVLWPETIDAIITYAGKFRSPKETNERTLILNKDGEKYSTINGSSRIMNQFRKLLEKIGGRVENVNIGSLRHTYATVVDGVSDQTMINLTMGHTEKSLQKKIYKQFNLDELSRLKVVSDKARSWLYGQPAEAYTNNPIAKSHC